MHDWFDAEFHGWWWGVAILGAAVLIPVFVRWVRGEPPKVPFFIAVLCFVGIATFFLWEEHEAHLMGALPYVLLALCPLLHLFMHRKHHGEHS
jgi:uncharacterized membrane protein